MEQRNIVVHDQVAVKQHLYDIMQIHHVVRQHVQISQIMRIIQVMHQLIVVVGNVIQDITKVELAV